MPATKPTPAQTVTYLMYHTKLMPSMFMKVTPAMLPTLVRDPPVLDARAISCHSLSSTGTSSNISIDAATSGTLSTMAEEIPSSEASMTSLPPHQPASCRANLCSTPAAFRQPTASSTPAKKSRPMRSTFRRASTTPCCGGPAGLKGRSSFSLLIASVTSHMSPRASSMPSQGSRPVSAFSTGTLRMQDTPMANIWTLWAFTSLRAGGPCAASGSALAWRWNSTTSVWQKAASSPPGGPGGRRRAERRARWKRQSSSQEISRLSSPSAPWKNSSTACREAASWWISGGRPKRVATSGRRRQVPMSSLRRMLPRPLASQD
mmetsp:Transcript_49139/g.130480  ORF Transcript_49139/g.130480 Transcript_49139/m.130480 type:complete len:319 (-) Transcript_49139:1101-2057(-)